MRIILCSAALFASSIASAATPVDGWYTSVFGGYTYVPDNINITNFGLLFNGSGYNSGYNGGGRVGYQSNPLRYELEYTYLQANAKKYDVDSVQQTSVSGYASGNLFMANVYYDFPDMLPSVSPYLGAGIGYAYLQTVLNGTGTTSTTYFNASENAFAYQATAGLTYNFAEHYAVNIAYRYVGTGRADGFGCSFQAHLASAGAIYHFDQGNYK